MKAKLLPQQGYKICMMNFRVKAQLNRLLSAFISQKSIPRQ